MSLPTTTRAAAGEIIESVVAKGDLSKLSADERARYYVAVCDSVGLNPMTRPFEYITLQGKLTLYARRDCADQLRRLRGISLQVVEQRLDGDLLTVHVRAKDRDGRNDEDFGAVHLPETLKGTDRANAVLKAITKAKRRVTLSISGLGYLDETEIDDIPSAPRRARVLAPSVDPDTGEVEDEAAFGASVPTPATEQEIGPRVGGDTPDQAPSTNHSPLPVEGATIPSDARANRLIDAMKKLISARDLRTWSIQHRADYDALESDDRVRVDIEYRTLMSAFAA